MHKKDSTLVFADKNSDEGLRNGRRSRSPNGHLSDDGSADSDRDDGGMRVGEDYQVEIPDLLVGSESRTDLLPEKALLVWSPSPDIDVKLDEFISIAKEKYGYNAEQALGMLFWHKHDVEKAMADLPNFTPFPDEWTVEDKVLFEQAFQFHGKSFHRIRQMLPDKSIASLVKYYYSWKKTRSRTSLMDRQARKLANQREEGGEGLYEGGSNSDSEGEKGDKDEANNASNLVKSSFCDCTTTNSQMQTSPKSGVCPNCHLHIRRNSITKPAQGSIMKKLESKDRHNPLKSRKKPPRGMHLTNDDLFAIAVGPQGQGDAILKAIDSEVIALRRQVQNNKQLISALKQTTSLGIDDCKPSESGNRISARWLSDELLLAVQGVRKYGKDFKAIAEVIGNKTEAHIRNFFVNYRRRYNLDAILKEYEAENGPLENDDTIEKMDVDSPASDTPPPTIPSGNSTSTPTYSISSVPPPPLLKPSQSPTIMNRISHTLPSSSRLPSNKSITQQPPPLMPSIMSGLRTSQTPPQLSTRE